MTDNQLVNLLIQRLDDELGQYRKQILDGTLTLEEYRYQCGLAHGLDRAAIILLETVKESAHDDD